MPQQPDDLNRLLVEAQNYLGTNVQVPFQGQGDLAAGAAGLPAPPTGAPTGRAGQGAGGGVLGAAGGGLSIPDLKRLFANQPDLGTRGETGGVSLSDQLRSLLGGSAGVAAPGGEMVDITRGLFGGTGTIPSEVPGSLGKFDLGGSLSDVLRSPYSTGPSAQPYVPPPTEPTPPAVTGSTTPSAEAAGGVSGLGAAGLSGAALTAILGALAQITGDPQLAQAAMAAGQATTGIGAGAALSGAAGTGAAAGAGILALPLAGVSLANLLDKGEAFNFADLFTGGRPDPYSTFNPKLMANEQQQATGFRTLAEALPYVQNQQELGQLINTYNNYLATTQNAPVEAKGPAGPYTLSAIGGTGGLTHGQQTPQLDWAGQTQGLQAAIDALKGSLPGDPISAGYGEPGGGLSGEPLMRLWSQFMDRAGIAPVNVPQDIAPSSIPLAEGALEIPGLAAGFYEPGIFPARGGTQGALTYGQPGYDYAGSGFPAPGQYLGTPSAQWLALTGQGGGTAGAAPASLDSITAAALATPAGDFAGGMLPEEERKRLLA